MGAPFALGIGCDKKQGLPTNTSPLAPCQGCSKLFEKRLVALFKDGSGQGQGRAGPGQAGQGQAGQANVARKQSRGSRNAPDLGICQPGPQTFWGYPPDPQDRPTPRQRSGVWGTSFLPHGRKVNSGAGSAVLVYGLPHRSDGTLGQGPRSESRAPMQMVSGALGSLGFRKPAWHPARGLSFAPNALKPQNRQTPGGSFKEPEL